MLYNLQQSLWYYSCALLSIHVQTLISASSACSMIIWYNDIQCFLIMLHEDTIFVPDTPLQVKTSEACHIKSFWATFLTKPTILINKYMLNRWPLTPTQQLYRNLHWLYSLLTFWLLILEKKNMILIVKMPEYSCWGFHGIQDRFQIWLCTFEQAKKRLQLTQWLAVLTQQTILLHTHNQLISI